MVTDDLVLALDATEWLQDGAAQFLLVSEPAPFALVVIETGRPRKWADGVTSLEIAGAWSAMASRENDARQCDAGETPEGVCGGGAKRIAFLNSFIILWGHETEFPGSRRTIPSLS